MANICKSRSGKHTNGVDGLEFGCESQRKLNGIQRNLNSAVGNGGGDRIASIWDS